MKTQPGFVQCVTNKVGLNAACVCNNLALKFKNQHHDCKVKGTLWLI